MRVKGRPIRTDTSVSDTGILQLEATLGRAPSLTTVPLGIEGTWTGAPLGEGSRLFFGRDLGLRGNLTLTTTITGSLSRNTVRTRLEVTSLRRSDFVPADPLTLNIDCTSTATRIFHEFNDIRCTWPIPDGNGATLALAGSIPDVLRPRSADIGVGMAGLPAATLLNWLRVASSRIPPSMVATGLLSGRITHETTDLPQGSSNAPRTPRTEAIGPNGPVRPPSPSSLSRATRSAPFRSSSPISPCTSSSRPSLQPERKPHPTPRTPHTLTAHPAPHASSSLPSPSR